jgi:hypothetical protein
MFAATRSGSLKLSYHHHTVVNPLLIDKERRTSCRTSDSICFARISSRSRSRMRLRQLFAAIGRPASVAHFLLDTRRRRSPQRPSSSVTLVIAMHGRRSSSPVTSRPRASTTTGRSSAMYFLAPLWASPPAGPSSDATGANSSRSRRWAGRARWGLPSSGRRQLTEAMKISDLRNGATKSTQLTERGLSRRWWHQRIHLSHHLVDRPFRFVRWLRCSVFEIRYLPILGYLPIDIR